MLFADFFLYGLANGDTKLPSSDRFYTLPPLDVPIVLFNRLETNLYVSMLPTTWPYNGHWYKFSLLVC